MKTANYYVMGNTHVHHSVSTIDICGTQLQLGVDSRYVTDHGTIKSTQLVRYMCILKLSVAEILVNEFQKC